MTASHVDAFIFSRKKVSDLRNISITIPCLNYTTFNNYTVGTRTLELELKCWNWN